ncbi:MAG: YdcF family protein, partial [Clostridia bacterium]|nr:YdcF family protein [Clostridia bacterium]
ILSLEEAQKLSDVDCIIVLGCLVKNGTTPSSMLKDRLNVGISLYKLEIAPKIIMSGDHGTKEYDEVNVMKDFALEKHVAEDDIFMDHAGFSTYESMYRAKEIFGAKKVIIVTQGYHIYRAIYDARKLGLEAYGVTSDLHQYGKVLYNTARESAARCKDFIWCIFKPEPTYLGDKISLAGSGNVTNG